MTGDILAKMVLEIRPDLPVILCTGFNEHISETKAFDLGIRKILYETLTKVL